MRPTNASLGPFAMLAVLLALLVDNVRADFNDGVVALMTGHYDKALESFVPLAETADHAYAQYFLARMYAAGQGVDQDFDIATKWFRKAAEKGVGDAQHRLGKLYESGEGVPMDMEYAFGWYAVAAHVGNAKAAEALETARLKLSGKELIEAQKLAQELIDKYGVVPKSTARTQ